MDKQLIVFCNNYRRELESLNLKESFSELDIAYFPNRCGLPPIEWSRLRESIPNLDNYQQLHIISCGSINGLSKEQTIIGCNCSNDTRQCYHLLTNPDLAGYYIEQGYFLVTPGWLASWPDTLAGWGFDQPQAIQFFKDTSRAILLLDTGVDSSAEKKLAQFADYVNLPFKSLKVGLEYLKLLLTNKLLKTRNTSNFATEQVNTTKIQRGLADFAMTLDLLDQLARIREEGAVIEKIKEIFTMLLAPQIVKYRPANDKKEAGHLKQEETTDSFTIQITGNSGLLGYLEIIKVNQPQFLDQYKKLADRVINICALAIENAHHYQLIKDLSDTDDLTRLANRRRLDEQLREEWRRMQRNEKPLTVMMFDIDFFKHFNDRYGHQAGDDCLKAVAAVLANYCRRSGDLAARFGGEEFVLILPEVKETNAVIIAENIRKEIEGLKIAHDDSAVSKYVTMSIGVVSQVPTTEMPAEKMIAAADKALYKAKETGRNRVVIAD